MVMIVVRLVVIILYCKRTQGFSVIIQFSSDYPQMSHSLQILLLLILTMERNPDSSAKPALEKLDLPESIHFTVAVKILGQS